MKTIASLVIFFLAFALDTWGAALRCQDLHAVPRLENTAQAEQTFYRNGYFFRMVRMDPSLKNGTAYQRAERYVKVDFLKSLQSLRQTENFVEMIQASNPELLKDAWVMLMYATSDTTNPIAGAAFVLARHPGEKLLMEKELQRDIFGEIIPTQYPIAEVARVGVDVKESNSDTFPMLIRTITDVMRGNLDIRHFYGFTSLGHQRFYEKLKHKVIKQADHATIPELSEKHIIIETVREP